MILSYGRRRQQARWSGRTILLLLLLPAGVLSAWMLGLRVNMSTSLPPGLYRVVDAPATVGRIVRFCPGDTALARQARERGYLSPGICQGNYRPLLKRVAAVAGDHIRFDPEGVRINGARYEHSRRAVTDPHGRLLPVPMAEELILGDNAFLPMSGYTDSSYDGRYFGAVDRTLIIEVIEPLWVADVEARRARVSAR